MLDFVSRYRPADAEEVYDIMNALDDRLATPNSAVVLATVRVFLNMTLSMPYDHQQARPPSPQPYALRPPAGEASLLSPQPKPYDNSRRGPLPSALSPALSTW